MRYCVNSVAEQHFLDKGMGSLEQTPALLHTTFSDIRPVKIQGEEVGAFTIHGDKLIFGLRC